MQILRDDIRKYPCFTEEFGYAGFIGLKNNAHVNRNYSKLLQPCPHHEEGIQHLTVGQLQPQLGFIKELRKVPHFPQWSMPDGTG